MVPELRELIVHNMEHGNAGDKKAAANLKKVLDKVLNSDSHKWFLGKEDPKKAAERKQRQAEFKDRYKKTGGSR